MIENIPQRSVLNSNDVDHGNLLHRLLTLCPDVRAFRINMNGLDVNR